MLKEAKPFVQGYVYAQRVECEEPCEGRLSRTVLWEGEGGTPSLYSTQWFIKPIFLLCQPVPQTSAIKQKKAWELSTYYLIVALDCLAE